MSAENLKENIGGTAQEGLYMASEGKSMNHIQRTQEQKEIKAFLACAFGDMPKFNL